MTLPTFVLSEIDDEAVKCGWKVAIVHGTDSLSGHGKTAWEALCAACGETDFAHTLCNHQASQSTRYNETYRCNETVALDSEGDILYTIFSR